LTPGDPGAYDRLEIALVTWGGGLVIVNVVDDGQVLRGVGPAVGVPSGEAIYVVALGAPVGACGGAPFARARLGPYSERWGITA
jgi:hypothetical protein